MASHPRLLALALTLIVLISPIISGFISKATVNITNVLEPAMELRLHCKSKDDDLGPQVVGPGKSWSFRFRPMIFGSTLFFCRMEWAGIDESPVYVDIFDGDRDTCRLCCWNIHATGPCFHKCDDKSGRYTCYFWKKT